MSRSLVVAAALFAATACFAQADDVAMQIKHKEGNLYEVVGTKLFLLTAGFCVGGFVTQPAVFHPATMKLTFVESYGAGQECDVRMVLGRLAPD